MPELLFDLARINPRSIQYDRAAIGRVNPHRGTMALVDGVHFVDPETSTAAGFMDARPDMFWVPGHFPGNPVLPGVIIVEAAAQLCSFTYKILMPQDAHKLMVFGGVDHVRFRGIVRPEQRVTLLARKIQFSARMMRSSTQAVVDGKVVYDGDIIGVNA